MRSYITKDDVNNLTRDFMLMKNIFEDERC